MADEIQLKLEAEKPAVGVADTIPTPFSDPKEALKDLKTAETLSKTADTKEPTLSLRQIDGACVPLTIVDGNADLSQTPAEITKLSATTTSTPRADVIGYGQPEKSPVILQFPSAEELLKSGNTEKTEKCQYTDNRKSLGGPGSDLNNYDPNGKLLSADRNRNGVLEHEEYGPNEKIKSKDMQFPDGHTEHHTYDDNGKVTSVDAANFADKHTQHEKYDANGKLTSINAEFADGHTELHTYGANGKVSSIDAANFADKHTRHENYIYDANGKLASASIDTKYADGGTQHQDYNAKGKMVSLDTKFADGHTEHNTYDGQEKLTSSDVLRADGTRQNHTEYSTNGQITESNYDAQGKLKSADVWFADKSTQHVDFNADGGATASRYDAHGKLTSVEILNADKSTILTQVDANGKVISIDERWADGGTSSRAYDPVSGKLLSDYIHYADNTICAAEFDPVTGNLKSQDILNPDGTRSHKDYDPNTGKEIPETVGHAISGIVSDASGAISSWLTSIGID